jgi:hypothetical protein
MTGQTNSMRSVLWFTIAMTVALIVYSFARNHYWTTSQTCPTLSRINDLEGEAYLLNRKINACRAQIGSIETKTPS